MLVYINLNFILNNRNICILLTPVPYNIPWLHTERVCEKISSFKFTEGGNNQNMKHLPGLATHSWSAFCSRLTWSGLLAMPTNAIISRNSSSPASQSCWTSSPPDKCRKIEKFLITWQFLKNVIIFHVIHRWSATRNNKDSNN